MDRLKIMQLSSLERVFLDSDDNFIAEESSVVLKGERFSYQIAFYSSERFFINVSTNVSDGIKAYIREVGNVPSEFPCHENHDDGYERTKPGLFPDVLFPIDGNRILVKPCCFHSLWITAEVSKDCTSGEHCIDVILTDGENTETKTMKLLVLDAVLPEQKLIYTQWFHADCIADYYNVPVFSEKHWELIDSFMAAAAHTGINMLLTPVFTPPLDTEVGSERLTTQLVDVKVKDGKYHFDFKKLRRWINMARDNGIKYFEISHLFTQWGATAAPKIIADVNDEKKRIFGWDTPSDSDEYGNFLHAFLNDLKPVLISEGIENNTFFHISDEPDAKQIESYSLAKSIVEDDLKGYTIIDAMSEYEFYQNGIISNPIPNTDHIEEFIDKGVEHRWTYYCCAQSKKLSNRFFGMPLSRTKILGIQLYKYGIEGFLQWGFNFYNSAQSLRSINPFEVTDADAAFPSGDAFTVYPYKNGAIESVRSEVIYEAFEDMRALELLGSIIGKEKSVAELEKEFGTVTFKDYPQGTQAMLQIRNFIRKSISENM